MIIKSLELHNFRQFMENEYGEGQRITFSTDSNKKATLLIAKNATGKTTLLQSFSWVLYGEANGLKTVINIDMQQNMHPGDEKIIKGSIILEHLGIDYVIERMMKIKKISVNIKKYDSELKIKDTDKDGNNKELMKLCQKIYFHIFSFKVKILRLLVKKYHRVKHLKKVNLLKQSREC